MQADVKVYMKILQCICCCYNILSVDCWIATEIYASTVIEFSLDPNKFSVQSAAELKRGLTAFVTILWCIMMMDLRICPNVLQYKYKKVAELKSLKSVVTITIYCLIFIIYKHCIRVQDCGIFFIIKWNDIFLVRVDNESCIIFFICYFSWLQGAYFAWKATAMGKNHINGKTFLEKR